MDRLQLQLRREERQHDARVLATENRDALGFGIGGQLGASLVYQRTLEEVQKDLAAHEGNGGPRASSKGRKAIRAYADYPGVPVEHFVAAWTISYSGCRQFDARESMVHTRLRTGLKQLIYLAMLKTDNGKVAAELERRARSHAKARKSSYLVGLKRVTKAHRRKAGWEPSGADINVLIGYLGWCFEASGLAAVTLRQVQDWDKHRSNVYVESDTLRRAFERSTQPQGSYEAMAVPPRPWHEAGTPFYSEATPYPYIVSRPNQGRKGERDLGVQPAEFVAALDAAGAVEYTINEPLLEVMKTRCARQAADVEEAMRRADDAKVASRAAWLVWKTEGKQEVHRVAAVEAEAQFRALDEAHTTKKDRGLSLLRAIADADELRGGPVYFAWRADFRGRMYCMASRLNLQGSDEQSALLLFGDKQRVGADGLRAVKIAAAGYAGMDKGPFDSRVAWFDSEYESMAEWALGCVSGHQWALVDDCPWWGVEKPYALLSLILGLPDALDGKPVGLACRLDATCSAVQLQAGLLRDADMAKLVNLGGCPERADVYDAIGAELTLPSSTAECLGLRTGAEQEAWLVAHRRKLAKKPVMLKTYGGTEHTLYGHVKDYLVAAGAVDRQGATGVHTGSLDLRDAINRAYNVTLGESNTHLRKALAQAVEVDTWTMPDGFQASNVYREPKMEVILTPLGGVLAPRKTWSFDMDHEGTPRDTPLKSRRTARPPNVIHSIDAAIIRQWSRMMDHIEAPFYSIHDCIVFRPDDWAEARMLAGMAYEDTLAAVDVAELTGARLEPVGTLEVQGCTENAPYFLS